MGLIFYLSSRGNINVPMVIKGFDKVIHACVYMVLAFLLYLSIHNSGARKYVFIGAFIFAIFYGISDEIHQYYVPGRDAAVGDVIADAIGAFIGCFGANRVKSV